MSKFTLVLDSTQLNSWLECPQRWNYMYQEHLVPKAFVEKEALNAGAYGHKLLDVYYKGRSQSKQLGEILTEASCVETGELKRETKCQVDQRFKEYIFNYMSNDFEALSENHVEVGFSHPIFEDSENLFILEGRIDLIGTWQGMPCIVDHKFQMMQHWLYTKGVQFKNYALVASETFDKSSTMIVNYIRLHKIITNETFHRELITFTKPMLSEWKNSLIGIFFNIKKSMKNANGDGSNYDKNWHACQGSYTTFNRDEPNFCFYNPLCESYSSDTKELKKHQLFKIKEEVWRPW